MIKLRCKSFMKMDLEMFEIFLQFVSLPQQTWKKLQAVQVGLADILSEITLF